MSCEEEEEEDFFDFCCSMTECFFCACYQITWNNIFLSSLSHSHRSWLSREYVFFYFAVFFKHSSNLSIFTVKKKTESVKTPHNWVQNHCIIIFYFFVAAHLRDVKRSAIELIFPWLISRHRRRCRLTYHI